MKIHSNDTPKSKTKIVIIEDHAHFREGLTLLIQNSEEFTCVGSYPSVESALDRLPEAEVILLDFNLPGMSGVEGIPKLKHVLPAVKIIMITVYDNDESIFNAILAGADGYLLKKTPPSKVLDAIAESLIGGTPMSPYVANRVIEHFPSLIPKPKEEYGLTSRENEILVELIDGLDSRQIAGKLFISYETVRNHLKHIYEKLHVTSRSQAVAKAIQEHIVK